MMDNNTNQKKKEWDDKIQKVYNIIHNVLYSITLNRCLCTRINDGGLLDPIEQEFWVTVSDNAIQMAAINWCKLFGTEKNNQTYYSKYISKKLFIELDGEDILEKTSKNMRVFRDGFVAHSDSKKETLPVPFFDYALLVINEFDKIVQNEYEIPVYRTIEEQLETISLQVGDCLDRYGVIRQKYE